MSEVMHVFKCLQDEGYRYQTSDTRLIKRGSETFFCYHQFTQTPYKHLDPFVKDSALLSLQLRSERAHNAHLTPLRPPTNQGRQDLRFQVLRRNTKKQNKMLFKKKQKNQPTFWLSYYIRKNKRIPIQFTFLCTSLLRVQSRPWLLYFLMFKILTLVLHELRPLHSIFLFVF